MATKMKEKGTEGLDFKVNGEMAHSGASFIPEFATGADGKKYMRPHGRSIVYRVVSETKEGLQTYKCNTCGSEILSKEVAHPIWDMEPPFFGFRNECSYEKIPYCPKCEKKP